MKKLALFLLVINLFGGCDDDDKPQNWTRYEYLADELKDYTYFKRGTWWVYKKTPGGDLDTIEVQKNRLDTFILTDAGKKMYYEDMRWEAKSRRDDYVYTLYRAVPPPFLEIYDVNKVVFRPYWIVRSKPGSYQGETITFFYPLDPAFVGGDGTHETNILPPIDTLTIQGNLYRDVQHFEASHDGTFVWDEVLLKRGGVVQYYWAPHIGIVKKEHMTKDIKWELVESHIVQ